MTAISWTVQLFAAAFDAGDDRRGRRGQLSAPKSVVVPADDAERTQLRHAAHQALLARIRAGDDTAFETIFREFSGALYDYVRSLGHPHDAADDIVEEVFLKLWRIRSHWSVTGSLASYLYVAARHQASNYTSRERTRWRLTQAALDADTARESSPDVEQSLDVSDQRSLMERTVSVLPAKARMVFLLYYRDGLTYGEIAERLQVARKTVENQLARSLKLIAERLAKRIR